MAELFDIRIKLTEAMLAARRGSNKIRRFDIAPVDKKKFPDKPLMWEPNLLQWRWALKEALEAKGLSSDSVIDFIRLPNQIKCPSIHLYQRNWKDSKNPGVQQHELFEAFNVGSEITIPILIVSELEDKDETQPKNAFAEMFKTKPPTKQDVIDCFEIIGANIGLSPWGSKFGYGRFVVIKDNDQQE